jgi:hypothetical protein
VQHLVGQTSLETIYFVLFDEEAKRIFEQTWKRVRADAAGSATTA